MSVRVALSDQREALIIAIVSPVSFRASLMTSETNWRILPGPSDLPDRKNPYNDTGRTTDGPR